MFNYKYINDKYEKEIHTWKYRGGSDSILYEYVWSPLTNCLVERVIPDYIAPNTVTLIGFIGLIIAHIITAYFCYDFNQTAPAWVWYMNSVAILNYQILDNADGKQARKTKNSSPLGMLFDHGCDAVATFILGLNFMFLFKFGSTWMSPIIISWALSSVYFAMWSNMYTGTFKLGRVNGVDEGLVVVELFFFFTGYFGQQIWDGEGFFGLTIGQTVLIALQLLAVAQIVIFIADAFSEGIDVKHALKESGIVVPAFYYIAFSIANFSPEYLIAQHNLMVAHITHEPYNQFAFQLLIPSISILIYTHTPSRFIPGYNDVGFLLYIVLLVFSILSYLHLAICIIRQISSVLQIHVFQINHPKEGYSIIRK